jgi:thiosulfate/3-mercaptopyruvate sulfurtransferase
VNSSLLSTYDYVKSGVAQVVDARTELEYQQMTILSARNLPYDQVLDGKRIKSETSLKELFLGLDKDRPVVVFTNTGVKASLVWFALMLGGYDARVYTWQDWLKNQPVLNISLVDIKAVPNPARSGDDVNLTVVFGDGKASSASLNVERAGNATGRVGNGTSEPFKEIRLTTKGCATCGFGSPQSFAKIDKSSGVARLGASPSEGIEGFSCLAIIRDSNGGQLGKIALRQASGGMDVYSGIWKANVAGGTYDVTLQASTPGATKNFSNVLQIDVVDF